MKIILSKRDLARVSADGKGMHSLFASLIQDFPHDDTPSPEQVREYLVNSPWVRAISVKPLFFGGVVIEFSEDFSDEFSELVFDVFGAALPHLVAMVNALVGKQDAWTAFVEKWLE